MIQIEDVSKVYRVGEQEVAVLSGVTEHVREGEYVSIMGPSGSGKSTLLNLLGCLLRPTSGSYRLNGQDVGARQETELSHVRQRLIGFVFQSFHLIPRLTAAGNVELPMMFAGVARAERRTRVAEALDAVGMTNRAHHRPMQLSVGQRQRVVIARATVMNPPLILADEPTGNLDSESGRHVLDLLDHLHRQGCTLIVVTHAVDVAQRAERVLIIRDGRITQRLPSHQLTAAGSAAAPS